MHHGVDGTGGDIVQHGNSRTGELEAIDIERCGEQHSFVHVREVSGRQVTGEVRALLLHQFNRAYITVSSPRRRGATKSSTFTVPSARTWPSPECLHDWRGNGEEGVGGMLGDSAAMRLVSTLIDLYSLVILAAVIMSWVRVDPRHPLARLVYRLTEPVLAPIRRVLPPMGGLDLSPMVLLVALRFLSRLW